MFTSLKFRSVAPLQNKRTGKGARCFGLAALLAMSAATAQVAPLDTTGLDASGKAKSELATCNSGKTQQDRAACLREVRNANAEKRAGTLHNGGDYSANAMRRCEVFKESEDAAACRARVQAQAQLEGSVAGGGVLRQSETVVPAAPQ
ncbi:hypothetical protein [Polaromonas sp.]|uniref:hypothetical protein n=1 Tax=Polaromonas sp. TaxID=1869339 RepID=UPI0013B63FBA|nr:hypothetical protein [Polaromonas sp.]NDP61262.1 hypothetical protein [Polaromonas sp.]